MRAFISAIGSDADGRKRVDGKFLGPGGSSVPEGQALLSGILDTCFEVVQDVKAREAEGEVTPSLKPIYDRLLEIKSQLDRLRERIVLRPENAANLIVLTHRWTLRETDLYKWVVHVQVGMKLTLISYAMALREIDQMRVDGKFVDANGEKAEGQYASCHYPIARHKLTNRHFSSCFVARTV